MGPSLGIFSFIPKSQNPSLPMDFGSKNYLRCTKASHNLPISTVHASSTAINPLSSANMRPPVHLQKRAKISLKISHPYPFFFNHFFIFCAASFFFFFFITQSLVNDLIISSLTQTYSSFGITAMLQSLSLSSSSSLILDLRGSRKYRISCSSSSRNNGYIPKLEPFSRSKLERAIKDPPLIQRSENQLAGKVSFFFTGTLQFDSHSF